MLLSAFVDVNAVEHSSATTLETSSVSLRALPLAEPTNEKLSSLEF